MSARELRPLHPGALRLVPDAPLPAYRFVPERAPHPRRDPRGSLFGAPGHPPGLPRDRWREDRSWLLGIDLYHQGFLWEAHEAWEACFFAARVRGDAAQRDLAQALIQLAAALLQAHLGRGAGVRTLAAAVVRRLRSVLDATPADARLGGIDPRTLLADVERHLSAALDGTVPAADAHRTSGAPPRLDVAV